MPASVEIRPSPAKVKISATPSVGAAGHNDELTAGRRDRRPIPIAIPGYWNEVRRREQAREMILINETDAAAAYN